MTGRAAAFVLLGLTLAQGCVYATKVKSGGRDGFRIHCQSQPQCVDKAGEVCAGKFEVLSSNTQVDGYANNGTGYANSPFEIVIACATGGPARSASPRAASPPPVPQATSAAAPDAAVACTAAHASLKETAAFWSQLHPEAKRLDELPSQRDFTEVCRALPERVQRCLDARYREAHEKRCLSVLKRLDAKKTSSTRSLE